MQIEVLPVAITQVDLPTYRRVLNPEARLDGYFINPDTLGGYLASLVKEGDPRHAIRNVNYLLRHISASFYIRCTERELQDIRFFTSLTISWLQEELFLVTGTLEEWKSAAIELCVKTSGMKTRYILNCCLLYLEKFGLMDVFGNYSKQTQPDQTFILTRKE